MSKLAHSRRLFANGDPFTAINPAGQEAIVSLAEATAMFSRLNNDPWSQAAVATFGELLTRTG